MLPSALLFKTYPKDIQVCLKPVILGIQHVKPVFVIHRQDLSGKCIRRIENARFQFG
jgi:hypothetical protein